jgi:hypothetical protein
MPWVKGTQNSAPLSSKGYADSLCPAVAEVNESLSNPTTAVLDGLFADLSRRWQTVVERTSR